MNKRIFLSLVLLICLYPVQTISATKTRVAVLDLIPSAGTDDRGAAVLADKVSETLQNSGQFEIYDRNILRQRAVEKKFAVTGEVDQTKRVTDFGRELDVARIVWGRYTDMGRIWSMSLFMIDVNTGKQLGVVTDDIEGDLGTLVKAVPGISQRLFYVVTRGTQTITPESFSLPDIGPVELPPLPAGVDELDARIRQYEAIKEELRRLRETLTEKHPHVVFFKEKKKEVEEKLKTEVMASLEKLKKHQEEMAELYKPTHPAMQEIERRLKVLRKIPLPSTQNMVLIPEGEFLMGSPGGEGENDEYPQHKVYLDAFYIDKYEVTQEEYEKVVGNNPSYSKVTKNPVEVNWYEAVKYCNIRSIIEGLETCYNESTWECDFTKDGYRLPTEAEWEYACRAGNSGKWSFGDYESVLGDYAWYRSNSGNSMETLEFYTHTVGEKKPNAFGLYDMHGNVWEWCNDWYDDKCYENSSYKNPKGPDNGQARVLRGGSWFNVANNTRSADRGGVNPDDRSWYGNGGFRCARTP